MTDKEILTIATDIGYMLLKHGAEVYRAEQSVIYICNSFGITDVDVFAIPSSLVTTISREGEFITKTKRILNPSVDLDKVRLLNNLSREICEKEIEFCDINNRIEEIKAVACHGNALMILAFAMVSASFTIIFGGDILNGAISFAIGIVLRLISQIFESNHANMFLKITICAFCASLIAVVLENIFPAVVQSTEIIAGSLMLLVPGLALVNCMRDFMARDYMSGVVKLAEAMMVALATALGVAVVLLCFY
ncbi:MAG: threonine/serine exporter family protein [Bacillota bacterium]